MTWADKQTMARAFLAGDSVRRVAGGFGVSREAAEAVLRDALTLRTSPVTLCGCGERADLCDGSWAGCKAAEVADPCGNFDLAGIGRCILPAGHPGLHRYMDREVRHG